MMGKNHQQEPGWQEELPVALQAVFDRRIWETVKIGRSGMDVLYTQEGYLKVASKRQRGANTLLEEKERLQWLQGKLPVPQIYYYGQSASFEYLYLAEISGIMACDRRFRDDMPTLINLLVEALHMVHAVKTDTCPFLRPLQPRLEKNRARIVGGEIDEANFATAHQGLSPSAWQEQMEQLQPLVDEQIFIHGDFCLPNIFIDPQKRCISGFIDWGLCGVADRHQDLVDLFWSLGHNFDPIWIPSMQTAYGQDAIQPAKFAFYQVFEDL